MISKYSEYILKVANKNTSRLVDDYIFMKDSDVKQWDIKRLFKEITTAIDSGLKKHLDTSKKFKSSIKYATLTYGLMRSDRANYGVFIGDKKEKEENYSKIKIITPIHKCLNNSYVLRSVFKLLTKYDNFVNVMLNNPKLINYIFTECIQKPSRKSIEIIQYFIKHGIELVCDERMERPYICQNKVLFKQTDLELFFTPNCLFTPDIGKKYYVYLRKFIRLTPFDVNLKKIEDHLIAFINWFPNDRSLFYSEARDTLQYNNFVYEDYHMCKNIDPEDIVTLLESDFKANINAVILAIKNTKLNQQYKTRLAAVIASFINEEYKRKKLDALFNRLLFVIDSDVKQEVFSRIKNPKIQEHIFNLIINGE